MKVRSKSKQIAQDHGVPAVNTRHRSSEQSFSRLHQHVRPITQQREHSRAIASICGLQQRKFSVVRLITKTRDTQLPPARRHTLTISKPDPPGNDTICSTGPSRWFAIVHEKSSVFTSQKSSPCESTMVSWYCSRTVGETSLIMQRV